MLVVGSEDACVDDGSVSEHHVSNGDRLLLGIPGGSGCSDLVGLHAAGLLDLSGHAYVIPLN